ncbi:hypothetical protein [Ramlibacter tataouinensis]|uniref:hypothetical protein n=1 Tax=Ramlibacter tataouinensis TaxID=94132 RepID=UPI0011AE3921|nr:hypothetical protein [Ramlibacter tataouinensis]
MSVEIRHAPRVDAQPVVVLATWRVFASGPAVMLAGVLAEALRLRITTPVQSWQPSTRTWSTSSGRVYHTPGPPTSDALLQAVLERFAQVHVGICDVEDVTERYWRRIQAATQ